MNIRHVYETATRFGINAAAENIAYRAARKVTEVTHLKALVLTPETVDKSFLADDSPFHWSFLDAATLHASLAKDASLPLDAEFIDQAFAKGDRCYGAMDGDSLVAFGWYSTRPTAVTVAAGAVLHFDSAYAYMYRGFTHPAQRGKRLHGIGMARALEACAQTGSKGLVSAVDSSNFASLSSCYRLGYRVCGQIFFAQIAGQSFTHATKGCEAFGLRLEVPQSTGFFARLAELS